MLKNQKKNNQALTSNTQSKKRIKELTEQQLQQLPLSLRKCLLKYPQLTGKIIAINYMEMPQNQTLSEINQIYNKTYSDSTKLTFGTIAFMKLSTMLFHKKRSLLLSAPRKWSTVFIKYLIVPYSVGKLYEYVKLRQQIKLLQQTKQDAQANEIFKWYWIKHQLEFLYGYPYKDILID